VADDSLEKSPRLYFWIIGVWLLFVLAAIVPLMREVLRSIHSSFFVGILVIISTLFVAYFWLNGVKDLVYTFYYRLAGTKPAVPFYLRVEEPHVVLVYATCNDFSVDSLHRSMIQSYQNYRVVILDDSSQNSYKVEIDQFAQEWGIEVIRRDGRKGYKAGNLNNYLNRGGFDYFVILDSDEIIPRDFIQRSLDYFTYYNNIGIVQANHKATRNRNAFMKLFSVGVDSHWVAYQTVKSHHGFLSLLGHGAMISKECYMAAGGFPHLVAEDLCFSIEARNAGFLAVFAPDIMCEEEYPVSYLAFKKRHAKWTQGNMEFIKKYTRRIFTSKMTWFEKLDIFVFTYNLPLTALFSIYVIINVMVLPFLNYSIIYPLWMLVPTVLFLFAPMLNDIFYHRKRGFFALAWYLLHSLLLYGSMFFVGLRSSLTAIFGSAVFHVTPKTAGKLSRVFAFNSNKIELLMGIILTTLSMIFTGSFLPVFLIVLPTFCSVYLTRMHNVMESSPDSVAEHMLDVAEHVLETGRHRFHSISDDEGEFYRNHSSDQSSSWGY
jgi:cellulose synthase/poly-beta-1,6-N-acetylglucosamine synthase-like glycosyltransferase